MAASRISGDQLTGRQRPQLVITSLQNPRVKQAIKLRDRRPRDRTGRYIIEGYRCLVRACEQSHPMLELFICPELFRGENEGALIDRCEALGAGVIRVATHVFAKMAYRDRPEGLLAVAPQIRPGFADIRKSSAPHLLILAESIEKPGNLGTMLRSADATGVGGIILCDKQTDPFNPNVVRASTGALFSVPVIEATAGQAEAWLRSNACRVVAATPHASLRHDQADLTGPVAIAVGAEQYGLTEYWMQRAEVHVRMPMLGMTDSLNVATATTILLYEAIRQRIAAGLIEDPGAGLSVCRSESPG